MLLINKSDFLSEGLIKHWNDYFNEKGVKHLFFSALKEQNKIDNVDQDADSDQAESDLESESSDEEVQDPLEQIKIEDAVMETVKENIFSREFIEKDAIEKLE
jgi:ribosome biogenesis GTPase A